MWIVEPKIVKQPTWGEQIYNLFSGSNLAVDNKLVRLSKLIEDDPINILGERVWKKYHSMPLLIKYNHGQENSFQLHIKTGVEDKKWQPKPESWYFFDSGKITCGIKKGASIADYKKACVEIESFMKLLTKKSGKVEEMRVEAKKFISEVNPWQYVNERIVKNGETIDLSVGGLHHSWEENISVYEVQLDVRDEVSTIRAFDQGKIKDDGTIRKINIEDYFKYLDIEAEPKNTFNTKDYAMEVIEIKKETEIDLNESFCHVYIKDGEVLLSRGKTIKKGQSVFIPWSQRKMVISPTTNTATILKTYIK